MDVYAGILRRLTACKEHTCIEGPINDGLSEVRQSSLLRYKCLPRNRSIHNSTNITMHFVLLGATGRTGKHVLRELLAQGHTAVAPVRNTSSLEAQDGLTVVKGSPLK